MRRILSALGSVPLILALAAMLLAGCAPRSGASATASSPSSPVRASPAPTTLDTVAAWPGGGPAPAALAGIWYFPLHSSQITLGGNDYQVVQTNPPNHASGKIVVNGDEIDFFHGDACGVPLPGGVGRYRWTLRGSSLHFTRLNEDPCGRVDILAGATWTRTPVPSPSS